MHKIALVTGGEERLPAGIAERIRAFGDFKAKKCVSPEDLLVTFGDVEILWGFGPDVSCMDPRVLAQMPNLKALFRSGSGIDALPCAWAKEHGIGIYNTPESIAECVAEHAVALLLSFIRQIPQYNARAKAGYPWGKVEGMDWHISHRTLGLIGYGNIARRVEKMMGGFDMKVIHYDPFVPGSLPLETVLRESDYVSVHCPLLLPVYKAEAYLRRCVDSLLAQQLDDYEIILVDDGSPDASGAICDEYAARGGRVRCLHIDNGGQGRARNFGMEIARGDYLGFVDSDDWVEPDMYPRLLQCAESEGADVVVCGIRALHEDGREESLPVWQEGNPMAAAGSACNKLFRREAVGDIRFPEGLWYEDFGFSAKLLMRSGKTVYLPEDLYDYRVGQPSTMNNENARKNLDMLEIMEDLREFTAAEGKRDDFEYLLINHVLLDSVNRLSL